VSDAPTPPSRATDSEREQAVELLRDAAVDGRLTVEELAERADLAHRARTHEELAAVTADLAGAPSLSAPAREPERHTAVLGSIERRGRWRLAARNRFVAVLGSIELDLRQAVLPGPEVELDCVAVLGSVEVLVPEGVEVEVSGSVVLGSRDVRVEGDAPATGAPVVRIRAAGAFGSIEVRSRPRVADELRARILERVAPPPPPAPPPLPPR
jgi:uncharacterized protein DUF1707/cell wall-active antibiotic response 4TMS protein YvqF